MNTQQAVQPRASANGYVRRRVDREVGPRTESKMHSGKPALSNFSSAGFVNGEKTGGIGGPSQDRLVYVYSQLRGQRVEVHVKNGSIISGIFYGSNTERDSGIILKMAQVIKDGSVRVQKPVPDTVKKEMMIPAKDLVQVLAKDVHLTSEESANENAHERRKDLMVDSAISHSHHLDVERELERWTPDKDDPECPELDNIFDGTWNRTWNQFETNETLFGVKSTFDEELYTTKLERGPHMRGLEREALRIAREIEGEETHDRHLAEERGVFLNEDFDLDEESRYSAVQRAVDGRFEKIDMPFSDPSSTEAFGGSLNSVVPGSYSDIPVKRVRDEAQQSSTCSSVDGESSNQIQPDKDIHLSGSSHYLPDYVLNSLSMDDESRLNEKQIKDLGEKKNLLNVRTEKVATYSLQAPTIVEAESSKSEVTEPAIKLKGLSPSATAFDPRGSENKNFRSGPVKVSAANGQVNPSLRPGSSTSSPSGSAGATSASNGPALSPSSSVGSLSSEKSTLNPYAKEFKLNPNARSFTPLAPLWTHTPISEGPFYYTSNMPVPPNVHNLAVGGGFGQTFGGHQPVYNPQGAQLQSPQPFVPPNAPMYGQPMMLGQPRPMYYMPGYQPEMPYKGRNL